MPEPERTLVMTGATSGIGAHALARLTARPGTRAIIGARPSATRVTLAGVETLPLDLASFAEVRAFAEAVLDRLNGEKIDMLVLNAGAQFRDTSGRSADGYELTFAVNHLAHYLLARLLLPAVAEGGRIVITTSDTHDPRVLRAAPTRLEVDRWARTPGSATSAYAASKLGNLLTAEGIASLAETAQRRITVIAYNPGLTGGTGLQRDFPAPLRLVFRALRPVFILLSRLRPQLYMSTPEHAGDVLAQLANGTLTPPQGRVYASLVRGQLTYPDPSALAQDPAARDQMWRESADLTGLADR
ncbi:MAG TPA: SDR family NAD(P)-dependent oxidoreductase [Streptosporangiaceae bacterium]|nr:SDR family NAD(P)-dependent oxidoreductase [Streptosporangiaceae bacterium]